MFNKLKRAYERAVYGIDSHAVENPDTFTTDFYFFMANAKIDYMEENCDLSDKTTLKEFSLLSEIALGMASYEEMCSGNYPRKSKEFKEAEKKFKKGWKVLGDNMDILW